MRNCGTQLFNMLFSAVMNIAVAIDIKVSLCLLYTWHNCIITVVVSFRSITHAVPGF